MTAVMIALLAAASGLFVVFIGLWVVLMRAKAEQRSKGRQQDGGDGGATSFKDPDLHKSEENGHDGNAGDAGGD